MGKMTHFNLGVCLIHQKQFKEAEEILKKNHDLWAKSEKYRYWALYNLADIISQKGKYKEADDCFKEACYGLRTICGIKVRDRFLSLANVLWARHLLRWGISVGGKMEVDLLER